MSSIFKIALIVGVLVAPASGFGQTQWSHNGSVMSLHANGSVREFRYAAPRAGLPVSAGTVLFKGKRVGDTYEGVAYGFSSRCGALPYKVTGTVSQDQRTVVVHGKKPRVGQNCRPVDYVDDELVFSLIEPDSAPSAPGAVAEPREGQKTLICVRRVFGETQKLLGTVDESQERARFVAQAILYLEGKYCRETDVTMAEDSSEHIGDNCYEYSGMFRGERVFWGGMS